MELLVNDVRFTMYNICYKRILVIWVTLAFIVLLGLLFSGTNGLTLFGLGIGWLVLNAAAIFLSMYIKFKLQRNLERYTGFLTQTVVYRGFFLGVWLTLTNNYFVTK